MKFRIVLLIALLFSAINTYSLDNNTYVCEATESSYNKFLDENAELYRSNFHGFSKIYLDILTACPRTDHTFLRVGALYKDSRADEEIQSLVIDYFSRTVPPPRTVERNGWSSDVYVFAMHPSLTDASMKNLYSMAEKNEESIVAFYIASNYTIGRFVDTYDMVINDYVRKERNAHRRDSILEALIENAAKYPLLKSDYLVLASSENDRVSELAILRYESNSEEEYSQKLDILNKEKEIKFRKWYKFKMILFLLPFLFVFLMSPLLAIRRRQSAKIVIYKFLIWAPELAAVFSLLIWGLIFPIYEFWLFAIGLGFLIYKIRSLKWELMLSLALTFLLVIVVCGILFAVAGLASQGAGG